MNSLLLFFKAFIIGSTMLIPGVSGGTMALLLSIYKDLLSSISHFFSNPKKHSLFLLLFLLGSLFGIFLLSSPLHTLLSSFPFPTTYFFIGCILGGIPTIIKESTIKSFTLLDLFYLSIGLLITYLLTLLPSFQSITSFPILFLLGLISAIALVLPGISVSYLLLLFGLYNPLLSAISSLQLSFLFPFSIGLLFGILLTTKLLDYFLSSFPRITYLIILGFILSSLVSIFPGLPPSLFSILTLFLGTLATYSLSTLKRT